MVPTREFLLVPFVKRKETHRKRFCYFLEFLWMQNTMSESEKVERPTNQTALKNDSSTEVWRCIENIFSFIFT